MLADSFSYIFKIDGLVFRSTFRSNSSNSAPSFIFFPELFDALISKSEPLPDYAELSSLVKVGVLKSDPDLAFGVTALAS